MDIRLSAGRNLDRDSPGSALTLNHTAVPLYMAVHMRTAPQHGSPVDMAHNMVPGEHAALETGAYNIDLAGMTVDKAVADSVTGIAMSCSV